MKYRAANTIPAFSRILLTIFSVATVGNSLAQETECASFRPAIPVPDESSPVSLQADRVELIPGSKARFTGDLKLVHDGIQISAEEAVYDKELDRIEVKGGISLLTPEGDKIETSLVILQPNARRGRTDAARFQLVDRGHGRAERIKFSDGKIGSLKHAKYSGCPAGIDDWYMRVSRLEIDRENDTGVARHASLWFYDVPIFYWPYFDFPLSGKRKSGFLAPIAGGSDRLGATLGFPYYWNIAPNIDDTITPTWLAKRGLQIGNELRYLTHTSRGNFNLEYVPEDQVTNDARSAGSFDHQQKIADHWLFHTDLSWVSDREYLEDFGNRLAVTSQTHLPETVSLAYNGPQWKLLARAFGYQTIDDTLPPQDTPYSMLPQLRLTRPSRYQSNNFDYTLDLELTNFQRDNSITGERFYAVAEGDIPLRNAWGFVVPRVGTRYWGYNLSTTPESARPPDFEDKISFGASYASLDSGLIFERQTSLFDVRLRQTLEPRVYYLYVPYVAKQDQAPLFDTSLPDFSFAALFRENRFVGGDRLGDANTVVSALTTRYLDHDTGREHFRLSAGVASYLENRRVNLDGEEDKDQTSDYVAEAAITLSNYWYLQGSVRYDPETSKARQGNYYIQYNPGKDRIFNFGYRLTPNPLSYSDEQVDMSFHWPVLGRWRVTGRWNYSLPDDTNLETFAGIEYRKTCCWAARVFANRRLTGDGDQSDNILFQLELSGLARVGDAPDNPLKQGLFFDR